MTYRLGILGDIHLSVTPPGRRSESYLADLQAKLDEIAQAPDVDGWLLIGDLFHSKRADRIPVWLLDWVWGWLDRMTIPDFGTSPTPRRWVWMVPGNHDLADGSIESLARMPLTILGRHDYVGIAPGTHYDPGYPEGGYYPQANYFPNTSTTFMAVPGTGSVCDAREDPQALFVHDVDWVFAHAPVDATKRPWATYDACTLPLHQRTKGIVYGHQHDKTRDLGHIRTDGKSVLATGAIARGAINEADHIPTWTVLDVETGAVEHRVIQCARPKDEVYRWAERIEERTHDASIAEFTAALGTEVLAGFSRESLIDAIAKRPDLADPVKTMATEILAT